VGFNFVGTKLRDFDYQLIRDSKSKVDVLIVMVHWGIEYMPEPSATQKEIAHSLIDNGADVVVGNHPHWVQGYDTIDGKPIFYSLGNFVFDQAWSEETKSGLAIRLTYEETKLKKIEEMPVYMENFAQPSWRQ
jgi:poly-gamma-glutamate synthesis protein (capsule biosynthesis protein)